MTMARLIAMLCVLIASGAVQAHGLRISVAPVQDGLAGRVWYSDETPGAGNAVSLGDASGRELAATISDEDGRFAFAQVAAGEYVVAAEGEEGHRAEARITLSPVAGAPSADAAGDARMVALLRSELQPLREDIARFEQRIRLHDLIGGFGFIVGLCGLFVAWRARRH